MISAKDRAAMFTAELQALLEKWGASIELEDQHIGWEYNPIMVCYMDSVWHGDEIVAEFTKVDLGRRVDANVQK